MKKAANQDKNTIPNYNSLREEFGVILNLMRGQLAEMTRESSSDNLAYDLAQINVSNIVNLIKTILNSPRIKGQSYQNAYAIDNCLGNKLILCPKFLTEIIIPELVLNIKKYTENRKNHIQFYFRISRGYFEIRFINRIYLEKVTRRLAEIKEENTEPLGRKINDNLVKSYNLINNSNDLIYLSRRVKNCYITIIKLKIDD